MAIPLPRGLLVAFEGIDGAGKTTQATRLRDRLAAAGFEVVLTKEPTNGPWGRRIRQSARTGRMTPEEELHAFLEDRREHVRDLLAPGLDAGKVLLVDRYYFSTVAYQGARGFDVQELLALNESFAPAPDLLVLLDIDPAVGLSRVHGRGDVADAFENLSDLTRSRAIFSSLDVPGLLRLDATDDPDTLEAAIRDRLVAGPLFRRLCPDGRAGRPRCPHDAHPCPWRTARNLLDTAPGDRP